MTDHKRLTVHTGPGPFDHQVLLGDSGEAEDISDMVMGVDITVRPGHPPAVTLALRNVHAMVRADHVRLDQRAHAVLIDLGWTPPGNPVLPPPSVPDDAPIGTEPGCQHADCVLEHPHAGPAQLSKKEGAEG